MTHSAATIRPGTSNGPSIRFWQVAAFLGMTAVIAGAFGAHALKSRLDAASLITFETAARYQMYHALALLGVCWLASVRPSRCVNAGGVCMIIGIVLFSGSLYLLCFLEWRWLGPVTPLGGAFLIVAWLLLIIAGGARSSDASDPDGAG